MSYFPFFIEIGRKPCLVVGGGVVALRKIEKLLPFGAEITVVSPVFCGEIASLTGIHRVQRAFQPKDIEGMCFVIGATDDERVNAEISVLCKERNIPINIVDDREKCSFFFPALVKKGEFVAGFSSGGGSPLAARFIREQVEAAIPEGFDRVVELLAGRREQIKREVPDGKKREKIFREIFALALAQAGEVSAEEIDAILRREREDNG